MGNVPTKFLLIATLILSIMPFGSALCQEATKPAEDLSPEIIGQGFEKAMRTIEAEKQRAEEELKLRLRSRLDEAIDDWILAKEEERRRGLNQFVKQEWEDIPKYGPRSHYDYYLRDYEYEITGSDIVKTESLVNTYIGFLTVIERLYAEMFHSPNVSYRDDFLYTVTTPIRVKFEYKGGDFIPTDIKYYDSEMENSWPQEVKSEIYKKIF